MEEARKIEITLCRALIPYYRHLAEAKRKLVDAYEMKAKKLGDIANGVDVVDWEDYWALWSHSSDQEDEDWNAINNGYNGLARLIRGILEGSEEELTVAEVARVLGIREGTVRMVYGEKAYTINADLKGGKFRLWGKSVAPSLARGVT